MIAVLVVGPGRHYSKEQVAMACIQPGSTIRHLRLKNLVVIPPTRSLCTSHTKRRTIDREGRNLSFIIQRRSNDVC